MTKTWYYVKREGAAPYRVDTEEQALKIYEALLKMRDGKKLTKMWAEEEEEEEPETWALGGYKQNPEEVYWGGKF